MNKVFKLTNKYIILTTPLVIFSLISNVYFAISAQGKIINILISILLLFLMVSAFIAGWGNMLKIAVLNKDENTQISITKDFISGVGEYFLPSIQVLANMFLFFILVLIGITLTGSHIIGDIGVSPDALTKALENQEALRSFYLSLTKTQIIKINQWNLLILFGLSGAYLLTMLNIPTMFFKQKNPYKSLIISIKDLFNKNFFKTFGIYLLILFTYFIISIFVALSAKNAVLNFIMILTNFYYLTFVWLGIFYYYYHNFVEIYLGQNLDIEI